MGDNTRYAEFEFTVVTLYDRGALSKEILDALGRRHDGTDIDSGGSEDRHAEKDGFDLQEIVVSILDAKGFAKLPKKIGEARYEKLYELFSKITDKRWGWR